MNFLKQNQTVIIVVVIIVLAFVGYSFFVPSEQGAATLSSEEVSVVAPQDQDLISLLLELKSITLDDAIFSDPAFQGLQDFSQELVAEPVGRTNPFAPLGQSPAGRP